MSTPMSTPPETGRPQERSDYRDPDDYYRDRDAGWSRGRRRERGIFINTEARPGFVTTEFWLTLIGVAGLVILAFAADEIGDRFGIGCATAVLVAYVLSRGIAKAGSSDVKKSRLGD